MYVRPKKSIVLKLTQWIDKSQASHLGTTSLCNENLTVGRSGLC